MSFKTEKLDKILNSEQLVKKSINYVKKEYRPYDPGNYLYKLLMNSKKDIFSDEYLELTYTTLISWNMNSRGASLHSLDLFKKTIRKNKKIILELEKYKFNDFNSRFEDIFSLLEILFFKLKLCKTEAKIVTFSKTLHFLIPNLIIPIDRKYTFNFFYNTTQFNNDKQIEYLKEMLKGFILIYNKYNLKKYKDNIWNLNIPKTLDNIVIGFKY